MSWWSEGESGGEKPKKQLWGQSTQKHNTNDCKREKEKSKHLKFNELKNDVYRNKRKTNY